MTAQTLNTGQMHVQGNESYIVGLNLQVQGLLTIEQCVNQVQDFLYDEIGASGHFRAFPNSPELQTADFIESSMHKADSTVFNGCLTHNKDTMTTDFKFLVATSYYDDSLANEVICFQKELNILLGYEQFLSWDQINLRD